MRKYYILFLLTIIGYSCKNKLESETDLKPTYLNFKNAWQERNLYGKVKKLKQYKATIQNNKNTNKQQLTLKENFTEFGSLTRSEFFNNYGETTQVDKFYYNEKEYLIKSVSTNYQANRKTIQLFSYDTIMKTSTRSLTINDTVNYTFISTFNNDDQIIKQVRIDRKDTIVRTYEYKYDQNKIIFEKEFEKGKEISVGTYKYDNENQLTKYRTKNEWIELLTVNNWADNRILKQTKYKILPDSRKYLDEITEYDKLFNPLDSKIYNNSELHRELKYDYEFDGFGNWIKRTVSMKEHFANSNEFVPIYIEFREIKYW
ncbi:hypothetical protein ACFQ0R_11855 [Psychroflexus salinarum]|uniref:YD repeat-containing protein n=1 Tax=Psychroflexus salinarum TaxID=546024 RepID=A0ABW3GUH5_9FLAO